MKKWRAEGNKNTNTLLVVVAIIICVAVVAFAAIAVVNTNYVTEYIQGFSEDDYAIAVVAIQAQAMLHDVHDDIILQVVADPYGPEARAGLEKLTQLRAESAKMLEQIEGKVDPALAGEMETLYGELHDVNDRVIRLSLAGDTAGSYRVLEQEANPIYDKIDDLVDQVVTQTSEVVDYNVGQTALINQQTNRLMVLLAVVVVGLTVLAVTWSVRTINRRNAEAYRRERLFDIIVSNVDEVFIVFDLDEGMIEFISNNIYRVLHIPTTDAAAPVGDLPETRRWLSENVAPDALEEMYFRYGDRNASEVAQMSYEMNDPETGQIRQLETKFYPLAEGGVTKKIIGVTTDVTKDREAEEAMRDALVAAQHANAVKRQFMSRVSHEIRTPLNAIVGMQAIAERSLDDREKLRDCLHKIDISARLLLGLVNDVLDMSRLESGRMDIHEAEFSLDVLLDELSSVIYPRASEKQQEFLIERHNILARALVGDEMRISQVLLNFLVNAVKFTQHGGKITMAVSQSDAKGDSVFTQFTVTDNGPGIRPEFMERLFLPFEQDVTAERAQGTGLGLPISQSIASLMGGSVSVESAVGEGSTFTFGLRLKKARLRRPETGENRQFDFSGKHALVAEDNEINMEIIEELLRAVGFTVEKAMNGKQAVELFMNRPEGYFDLVMMDIQMPVMSGAEAAKRIRASGRADAHSVTMAAMTAFTAEEDVAGFLSGGFDSYFSKPILPRDLYGALAKLLERKGEQG